MKMRNWKTILFCGVLLTGLASCEDSRDAYLEDYQTLVYFRNSGEQQISLYLTGENTIYNIPICKSGRDLDGTADAQIMVMDQAQLDIYNIENGTNYVQLPANSYKFLTDTEIVFSSSDAYQVVSVEIVTNTVQALQEEHPENDYVLALQVYSSKKISESVNLLLLSMEIDVPQLSLGTSGLVQAFYTASSPMVNTYANKVSLNIDNHWDFTCDLEVLDQEWLDAYNAANGTQYMMLPSDSYTVPTQVSFTSGTSSVPFEVSVDRSNLPLLQEYLLPVRLTNSSKAEFSTEGDATLYMLNVRMDPDKITLTEDMITSPYTNTGDGQGVAALVDGDVSANSWWHSYYGGGPVGDPEWGYYLDITLKSPLSAIVISYATRSNPNAVPADIRIGVSNDGTTWTEIGRVNSGLPTGALEWATLPPFSSEESFTHIRFGVLTSAGSAGGDLTVETYSCVSLSELELYGADLTK